MIDEGTGGMTDKERERGGIEEKRKEDNIRGKKKEEHARGMRGVRTDRVGVGIGEGAPPWRGHLWVAKLQRERLNLSPSTGRYPRQWVWAGVRAPLLTN